MADLDLQRRILALLADGEGRTDNELALEVDRFVSTEDVLAERLELLAAGHLEVTDRSPILGLPVYSLTPSGRLLAGAPEKEGR